MLSTRTRYFPLGMLFGTVKETAFLSAPESASHPSSSCTENLTVRRPRKAARLRSRIISIYRSNLKPHIPSRFPRVDVGPIRDLRHVELHRPRVRHPLIWDEPKIGTGSHCGSACASSHLEAAYIG